MDKTYNPRDIEGRRYKNWEENGYFRPATAGPADGRPKPFCIMIPPPNVTGSLHMGHGFNNTIMDALTRYRRMTGRRTLWQPGTDHAGIATQMVVERQLERQGETRRGLGRERFIERVWQWREESGGTITRQLRRLGSSLDWENERFTMDRGLSAAVREVFVRLYDEGLIYRGKRLVNWDPRFATAISDLEVENIDVAGHMWHFKYPLAGGERYEYIEKDAGGAVTLRETRDYISIATTRPETMLGDGAVAVHPSDERYAPIVGKMCEIPVGPRESRRLIPIITDDYPDPLFGSGAVKITGAHDFNDYEVAERNNIPKYRLMDNHGRMRADGDDYAAAAGQARDIALSALKGEEQDADAVDAINLVPDKYRGLDRFAAREKIVADIDADGLMIMVEDKTITQPFGDRSKAVIEPLLTDQWYVKTAPLAAAAVKAVEDGAVRFIPDNWKNTYYGWMRDIQDWCISRQIWWGHRIPAWYDDDGRVFVGRSEQEVRERHGLAADLPLRQDEDVLDTWFSSALWPFSTLGWPRETERLKTFYPTSALVTGFDIIFFWVARMIMMGLKFMDGAPPFKDVYIHGLVRDSHGDKMSKSKGNVLDPIDLIDGIDLEALVKKRTADLMQPRLAEKIARQTRREFPQGIPAFGADALRFTFAVMASTGRDIKFDLSRIEGYRNFCNKLWNAARFVLMNVERGDGDSDGDVELSVADKWILSSLQETTRAMTAAVDDYRFDRMAQAVYDFTWREYCDWYLELCKTVLNNDAANAAQKRGARRTLITVLESILRLAHPIIPFITEEIWQAVAPLAGVKGRQAATIMLQDYPQYDESLIEPQATADMRWAQEVILGVRRVKAEANIAPARPVPVLLANVSAADRARLAVARPYIGFLAKAASVKVIDDETQAPESAIALANDMKILIPLAGLIDKDAERARLQKEIDKLEREVKRLNGKLANADFTAKAPPAVVAKERDRLGQAQAALGQLRRQWEKI